MQAGQWSTDAVPRSLRADAARAMLNQVHLPWAISLPDREDVNCRMRWQGMAGATLIECECSPLAGHRQPREIRHTDGNHVGLLLVLSGREFIRQGETAVALEAGDLMLWDSAQPLDFAFERPLQKVTLLLPKERLLRTGHDLDGARLLDGRSGLGALVSGYVNALKRSAAGIAIGDAPLAVDLVIDLLGRMMTPSLETGRIEAKRAGDLVERVLAHVERWLDDPKLSPSSIAAHFGVTPRYLHMAFSRSDRTLAAHIRRRRLDRLRRDLADARLDRVSITDLALRWGFNDAAHASRAFRQEFGISPSAFRACSV